MHVELITGVEIDLIGLGNEGGSQLLRWAGLEGEDAPDPGMAIVRIDSHVRASLAHELQPGEFEAFMPSGDGRTGEVRVRRGLPLPQFIFYLGHGGGHLVSYRLGHRLGAFEEAFASIAGRAVLMPQRPLTRVWRREADLRRLFRWWDHVPPEHVALRLGEAQIADVWLATRRSIRNRRASSTAPKNLVLEAAQLAIDRGPDECAEKHGFLASVLPDQPHLAVVVGPQAAFGF